MQNSVVDQKAKILFDKYYDSEFVCTTQREVEDIRNRATTIGIFTSFAAFGLNEVARLTMRSPMFKLRVQNVAFWAIAPTLFARFSYNQTINERIDNLWRIHKNREAKGLGGTGQKTGQYMNHGQDKNFEMNHGFVIRLDSLIHGISPQTSIDSPFVRFHENIEEYGSILDNADDIALYELDNFERQKYFNPKEKDVVGTSPIIPTQDTDEKLIWYDTQGESLYSNPPDPNNPVIDHGLDEEKIWAWRMTTYNQDVVKNDIALDLCEALKKSNVPWWGKKLGTPAFYKDEKYAKFFRQWEARVGLEMLKAKHAVLLTQTHAKTNPVFRRKMKDEIQAYLKKAQEDDAAYDMKDVYTTDHVKKTKKFNTLSEDEDKQFYDYLKSIEEYSKTKAAPVSQFESGRYERGSMKQRLFEPYAGAIKQENGTHLIQLNDKDLRMQMSDYDDDKLKAEYEKVKDVEASELDDEDQDAMRLSLVAELGEMESWDDILSRELGRFAKDEEYDYVTDMRRAYAQGLARSDAQAIFKTIPDYVFWDIKKPLVDNKQDVPRNPYNPVRADPTTDFFDARTHEAWLRSRKEMKNVNTSISKHRLY